MKIVLQNLTKRYPNRNKKIKEDVIAVNNFSFEIPDGQLIGLLGPSGCGKSTTLNMICGLEKPTTADRPSGPFRLRKEHDAQHDLRSGEAHFRQDLFWRR